LISNFRRVVYLVFILLGDTPPSEFYVPTFRNTLKNYSCLKDLWRWNRVFRNVGTENSGAGVIFQRKA